MRWKRTNKETLKVRRAIASHEKKEKDDKKIEEENKKALEKMFDSLNYKKFRKGVYVDL
jgi:hypothetical protein